MNIDEIQQYIIDADQIQIIGSASQVTPVHHNTLNMSQYAGIVGYHPEELVMTVKAGTTIKQIEGVLDHKGQVLPFYVQDNKSASIGGAYAMGSPELRDAVLGIKIIDGRGRLLTFGGQVMKNVAGYDVARLLVGSQGKLAVICEISFKVIPKAYTKNEMPSTLKEKSQTTSDIKTRLERGLKTIFDPNGVFV